MVFADLNLIPKIVTTLTDKGYDAPTPIQEQAIPAALEGNDIFASAQTGTGKTAAFSLPILQQLSEKRIPRTQKRAIRALILAPTRELASQISENIFAYSKGLGLRHTVVYGGASIQPQIAQLRQGVDILIATPGRLIDLMNQGFIHLDQVEFFVLDEADRMLDMGFIIDIKRIIAQLPQQRQTFFFSATILPEIMKLANSLLRNPIRIEVKPPKEEVRAIDESVFFVNKEHKSGLLAHLLSNERIERVLVFTRTKRGADKLVRELNNGGFRSECIHGDKSQNARERALRLFKNNQIKVLVATDVAARGIDVDRLTHVINFELPEQSETYVHRIGRTGRGGNRGKAYSFCSSDEKRYLKDISKLLRRDIPVVATHPFRARRRS